MGCFVVMIVGMVDDRAMRFRQGYGAPAPVSRRQPRPTPKPVAPEPTPPNPLEGMVNNYLRTSGQLADDQVKYGGQIGSPGSRTADLLVEQGVPDSFPLRAGAFVGDIALDPSWLVPGLGAAKGAQTAGRTINTVAKMSPDNRALYGAMMRGLYHGSRDTGAATAKPFTLANRDSGSWQRNWFGGDMFGATGKNVLDPKGRQVAEGYTQSAAVGNIIGTRPPGLTAGGFPVTRGAKFRLSEPANAVANRKILDLTEGTLDQVDPALYQRLVNEFKFLDSPVDNIYIDELAKMNLGGYNGGLHKAMYSNAVRPVIEDAGYDTIKHLSGQLQGDIVTPVYAFLNPAGMKATPTLPSLGRLGDVVDARISNVAQKGAEATGAAGAAIKEGGASALDSLAVALNRENMSSLPAPVRDFVAGRTAARGSGENFANIRQFNQNPQLVAFLKKLGLDKLWADAPEAARNLVEPAL